MKWLIGTACIVVIASGGLFLADSASAWMRSRDDVGQKAVDRYRCDGLVAEMTRRRGGQWASTEMSDGLLKLKLGMCRDQFADLSDQIAELL